ncbi:MAG: hypothetical protein IT382_00915 [Deltaproteobacteria bacterium]|nr:hypothetical protein [Deltaproteobacteria bacterium]
MEFIALVAKMSDDTFAEMVQASPRKIRETLFQRLGIKAKKTIGLKVHAKAEERTRKLQEKLRTASSDQENRLCEELARNFLYTKRPLLKATLDHLGIKNDNGLVDEEPTFFQELTAEKVQALVDHLRGQDFPLEHILVYLRFVKTPHLDSLAQKAA